MAKAYHSADTKLIASALEALAATGNEQAARALDEWKKLPFDRLDDGEPWFFLRGHDELAPRTIDFYAGLLRNKTLDELADEVDTLCSSMVSWQIKMPDAVRLPT